MEAIIFDMDGVIVDSEPIWIEARQSVLREQGIIVPDLYHYQLCGTTLEYMWSRMKNDFDLPFSLEDCILRGEEKRHKLLESNPTKPINGVIDFIRTIYKTGIPVVIASSSASMEIERVIEELNIRKYFKELVSGQDCRNSKPFPDVFLRAAKTINVNPNEVLVIEDSTNGVKAAKAAGMTCLAFQNQEFIKQDLSMADGVFSDFSELAVEEYDSNVAITIMASK